jgi:hypothetical protein
LTFKFFYAIQHFHNKRKKGEKKKMVTVEDNTVHLFRILDMEAGRGYAWKELMKTSYLSIFSPKNENDIRY